MINSLLRSRVHYQLPAEKLVEQTLQRKEGVLSSTGALVINTGRFTGRSPDDKFIVKDRQTDGMVHWNRFNNPIEPDYFLKLQKDMLSYLDRRGDIWMRDAFACADNKHRIALRITTETPWSNHFAANMFIAPTTMELQTIIPDWHVIQAPGFYADPEVHGTRSGNFTVVSFTQKTILIGGTGYTGEIKKGVFTVLNYILPLHNNLLPMHCSANVGKDGDTALFFGLSGTGKTTLSSDPHRQLIGDDEHGWDDKGVFNFEGGCYAKIINLSAQQEPQIYNAIKAGSLAENVGFIPDTNQIDYSCKKLTENTRVSYPLSFIENAKIPSVSGIPKNIFFLTCDAYGVLPPLSKLSAEQAMYQYINGYTAKVAGTEVGVTEPQITFSACFGAPFLPLHPDFYATMLKEKIEKYKVSVWLINTGWTGGGYGVGNRINLKYTRAMITAVLNGQLNKVTYKRHPVFGMLVPQECAGVPDVLLNPRDTWPKPTAYDQAANKLLQQFTANHLLYRPEEVKVGVY
jgi:phosphoenolpyruvate carboxykinase (ATP)